MQTVHRRGGRVAVRQGRAVSWCESLQGVSPEVTRGPWETGGLASTLYPLHFPLPQPSIPKPLRGCAKLGFTADAPSQLPQWWGTTSYCEAAPFTYCVGDNTAGGRQVVQMRTARHSTARHLAMLVSASDDGTLNTRATIREDGGATHRRRRLRVGLWRRLDTGGPQGDGYVVRVLRGGRAIRPREARQPGEQP
jgi:hypothetical protein